MAADDLSTANLPPLAWTNDATARDSRDDAGAKEKKVRTLKPTTDAKKPAHPQLEFEQTEHELDSIA
jgi:hypothetical protein